MTSQKLTSKKTGNTHQFLAEARALSVPEIYVSECMSESDFGYFLTNALVKTLAEQHKEFVLELSTGYTGGNSNEGVYRLLVCAVDFDSSN